jgi:putative heme transporter
MARARIACVIGITAGAFWAIFSERATLRGGFHVLADIRLRVVLVAVAAEFISMVAFVFLQRSLLRVVGARFTTGWLLSTAYMANAIAVAVPVVGSGMATGYIYRQFRQSGVEPAQAGVVLTLAGMLATVSFAVLVVFAAVVSGNLLAATGSLVGATISAALVAFAFIATRSPKRRAQLERLVNWCASKLRRSPHDATSQADRSVGGLLSRVGALHLGTATLCVAFCWALLNWCADAAVLVLAVHAVRAVVPWNRILLVWSAGIGAASLSPTPGGLGVVEVTMIAAMVAAGLHPPEAVAAVIVYRIITLKTLVTTGWLVHRAFI